jgi:MoaA/NifB/PqqE/SkfB family radical SAM enzyme
MWFTPDARAGRSVLGLPGEPARLPEISPEADKNRVIVRLARERRPRGRLATAPTGGYADRPMTALESRTLDDFRDDTLVWLSRGLNRGWSPPDWVSVNLTLKCNLSCSFCKTCYPVRQELSTREIKDIIDQTYMWGVKRFNPIGGEPFVRKDLEEILAYACAKDFYITLTTNGTLISERRAEKIARIPYNRLHFNISLDGPNPWNDMGRGEKAFDKALSGYRALRTADAATGNPLRKVSVNCIINALNLSDLPDFLYWCRDEMGVQAVQFLNLFRHGNKIDPDVEHLWITPDRLGELDDFVDFLIGFQTHEADQNFGLANTLGDLENIKRYYRGELGPLDGKCYSGWKELYINADGRAIMCDGKLDFLNGAFGDIRRQTLRELWTSPEIASLRRNVKNCTTPCIQDCYLRRRSDSAIRIARGVSRLAFEELQKRYRKRRLEVPRYEDSVLTLQLSDTLDLQTSWKRVPMERFRNLTEGSPEPFASVREDPFRFYEFRNRGYLQFNRGFLAFDVIKSIVEDAQRGDVVYGTLVLSWEGEALLHPQMEEILAWLAEAWQRKPFARRIVIPTNGTLLNHNYCRITAEAGAVPFTWLFEVDSFDKESYLLHHGEQLWDRVLDNINYLLGMVAEHGPEQMGIVLQDTITEATADGAQRFADFWREHLGSYGLESTLSRWAAPLQPGCHVHLRREDPVELEAIRAAKAAYRKALQAVSFDPTEGAPDETVRRTCAAAWKTPTVSWDGKLLLCTADVQQQMKVGEVTIDALGEAWWKGQRMQQIRGQIHREDLSGLSLCRGCSRPYSPNVVQIGAAELDAWAASSG